MKIWWAMQQKAQWKDTDGYKKDYYNYVALCVMWETETLLDQQVTSGSNQKPYTM